MNLYANIAGRDIRLRIEPNSFLLAVDKHACPNCTPSAGLGPVSKEMLEAMDPDQVVAHHLRCPECNEELWRGGALTAGNAVALVEAHECVAPE